VRVVMGCANCHRHQLIIHGEEYGGGFSGIFGADFKILASLEMTPGETRVEWRRLILSIQHIPKLPYERQHRILVPILKEALRCLEAGGLEGTACLKQFPRAACPVSNGRQPFQAQYYS
jgi:hypothetical protein